MPLKLAIGLYDPDLDFAVGNIKLETTERRSQLMKRVRQANTPPERAVRRVLHALGIRYRILATDLPGSPDVVNRSGRWAIFVNGCFWHAHEGCIRWRIPKRNRQHWAKKFDQNRERDHRKFAELEDLGYTVLVIWECETRDEAALRNRLERWLICHRADQKDTAFLRRKKPKSISTNAREVRGADIFCGCGGLSLGLQEACSDLDHRLEVVWAADSNPRALRVYRQNFHPLSDSDHPLEKWLPGELGRAPQEKELELKSVIGELDFLLAGPPCQGHSLLNNRTRHDDDRNGLYVKVGRLVEIVRPKHVFIENVPTIILDKNRSIFRTADHLKNLGYWVDSCVVDLSKIGVPQRRKRHIIVASRVKKPRLAKWIEENSVEMRSVRWAIGDLDDSSENGLLNTPSLLTEVNRRRVEYLFEHDVYDLPNELRPACHQDGDHTYKSMYGRLRWGELAQTIATGFSSPGQGRYIHPNLHRTLTPREAARLQFLPDSFDFSGVKYRSDLARMIGNAVPPKLSWVICRELMR